MKKTIATLTLIYLFLVTVVFTAATAWATVSYVSSSEKIVTAEFIPVDTSVSTEKLSTDRVRAPEPGTIALFGGGLFGMIVGFVRRTYAALKRALDIAGAFLGFIILSPLMLMTALLVRFTSKGPIIYSQTRVGKDGELFEIYKFRTMKVDAEKVTGAVWAQKNDPRLTPVGLFLRKAHLDELPQLFNVLKGEMSIIGPRPERPKFVDEFKKTIPGYQKRLQVKPGITGLAQVWHNYDETLRDVKMKLKYDILYIKKMCLYTDFQIILRTFVVVLTGEGAR
jgi:exopolysaccharide biosynthesis polyprenyl glycosylphosphotransferase